MEEARPGIYLMYTGRLGGVRVLGVCSAQSRSHGAGRAGLWEQHWAQGAALQAAFPWLPMPRSLFILLIWVTQKFTLTEPAEVCAVLLVPGLTS